MEYDVFVRMTVTADSDQDAYYVCQAAVENLVCGDIVAAEIDQIVEKLSN